MNQEQKPSVLNRKANMGWIYLIVNTIIFILLANMWSTPTDAPGLVFWGLIGFILLFVFLLVSLVLFIRDLIKKRGSKVFNIIGVLGNLVIVIIYLYLAFVKK